MTEQTRRRWGAARNLSDEVAARGLLLDALARSILRRGSADVSMAEVADEAGVTRSTLYRYFATRNDLLLALVLRRLDAALERVVEALCRHEDPAVWLTELALQLTELVDRDPLNAALFDVSSSGLMAELGLGSEAIVDVEVAHLGPLLKRWQQAGSLYADLDVRETVRWLNAVLLVLQAPTWRTRSRPAKRRWLQRYVVRALVPASPTFGQ